MTTRAELIARYHEMVDVPIVAVEEVLAEVDTQIAGQWPDHLRQPARLALAAHILASEGGATRSIENNKRGPISSERVGDVSRTYSPAGGGVVAYQVGRNYTSTPYGRRFADLRAAAFAGVIFAV